MNALTDYRKIVPVDSNISHRGDAVFLPLIATQTLFTGEDAGRRDPPRREPWRGGKPSTPWYRRLAGAFGRLLEPRQPRLPLTEHLCRDIGLDWTPERPVRTWPW
jgi:hypothetical protein